MTTRWVLDLLQDRHTSRGRCRVVLAVPSSPLQKTQGRHGIFQESHQCSRSRLRRLDPGYKAVPLRSYAGLDKDPLLFCCPCKNSENVISESCKHERAHFVGPLAEVIVCTPFQRERLSDPLRVSDVGCHCDRAEAFTNRDMTEQQCKSV